MNEPILMPFGTSHRQGTGMKWSTLGTRKSKAELEASHTN